MTKIEIDLDTLFAPDVEDGEQVGTVSATDLLRDAVVRAAVDRILNHDLRGEARSKIIEAVNNETTRRVVEMLDEIFAGPIQRTSAWGEKRGEPTTIKEIVRTKVEEFLTNAARRDTFGGGREPQNLSEVVAEQTRTILTGEFRKEIDEAKKSVSDRVRQEALAAAVKVLNGERV
jgi:hypothetical protein